MTHLSHHYTYSEQHVCSGGKSIWISNKHLQNNFFWWLCLSVKNEITLLKICMLKSKPFEVQQFTYSNQFYSSPFWTQNWTNLFENEFSSWKTYRNFYFTCFHLKKYHLKSYSILVMSLSQSLRSESYPIYNLCRNNVW